MNRKKETHQMLTRMVSFGNRMIGLFPKGSVILDLLKRLESGVETLSEEAAIQLSAEAEMRTTLQAKKASREMLRSLIAKGVRLSAALGTEDIKPPNYPSDRALIDMGSRLTRDSDLMKKEFEGHGLPKFADAIGEATDVFEKAVAAYATAKAKRSAAISRWNAALEPTLGVLRRFDVLVSNVLEDNAGALAEYAVARVVPRSRGRTSATTESPAPPAA
jgi:hypothetical protein